MTDDPRLLSNFILRRSYYEDFYLYSVSLTVCTL